MIQKAHNRMTLIAIKVFWIYKKELLKLLIDVVIVNLTSNYEENDQT